MHYDYLILGSGRAALSAAEAIRRRDQSGSIAMVSQEGVLPYTRPMLTKFALCCYDVRKTLLHDASWYNAQRVTVFLDTLVLALDAAQKTVRTTGGLFTYNKCIYALGAHNFIPPFAGIEKLGIYSIRTPADLSAIRRSALSAKHAVVIGGGVIGLEAAYLLHEYGLSVTVLETAPYLMPRLLDEYAAQYLASRITAFPVLTNARVCAILGDTRVRAVEVEGMKPLTADLVVISCGIRANLAIFQNAGGQTERAIVVDSMMRTSLPDVFACGDCAQFSGVNTGLWAQASRQGTVSGNNAAGGASHYCGSDAALILNCPEFSVYACGDCGKQPERKYECTSKLQKHLRTFEVNPRADETYTRDYYSDGKLVGTFMLGNLTQMLQKSREIAGK